MGPWSVASEVNREDGKRRQEKDWEWPSQILIFALLEVSAVLSDTDDPSLAWRSST